MQTELTLIAPEDRQHYHTDGYCHLKQVLSPSLLQTCQEVLESYVDDRAKAWMAEGILADPREDLDFLHRFNVIWKAAGKPRYSRSPGVELIHLTPHKVFSILTHPELLAVAANLLNTTELLVHSAWNSRPKTPDATFTDTPWHQDGQYFRVDAHIETLTIWFPLHAVDEHNSCLAVAPGSQGMALQENYRYEDNGFTGIRREQAKDLPCLPIAMQPGDALCFPQLTPHRAMPNRSDAMRWSMDFRYVRTSEASADALKWGIRTGSATQSDNTTYEEWRAKW